MANDAAEGRGKRAPDIEAELFHGHSLSVGLDVANYALGSHGLTDTSRTYSGPSSLPLSMSAMR